MACGYERDENPCPCVHCGSTDHISFFCRAHKAPKAIQGDVRKFLANARAGFRTPGDPPVWFLWLQGCADRAEAAEARLTLADAMAEAIEMDGHAFAQNYYRRIDEARAAYRASALEAPQ